MKCLQKDLESPLHKKVLLTMKLTLAFVLFFTLNLSANGFGQKINIKVKKIEIAEVLTTIEKQSGYRFLYNNELSELNTPVTINIKDAVITDVLPVLFSGTSLTYKMMDNKLIVVNENPLVKKDVTVRGQVMSDAGVPLAGVSVQVKGTTIGTTTNAEGGFALTVPNENVTLTFTYVGFNDLEYPLNGRTDITVVMAASQKVMDQVVVIGYGTANKRDLTGSIVKIGGKDVADKPNTNPVASLQGKVAGLYVVNNGTPGQAPDIRIRGTVSIGQVHPLYVVDGILQDNIDYINSSDIESIEILKDPSSLAIFGVKGATGVIAVTTKKAKSGQTLINFNTSFGFKNLVDKIQMANAEQFKTLFAEEMANDGKTAPDYSALTANTDWTDVVTRVGKFNNNSLSISNSTEKNKVSFGLGYVTDEGIIIREKLQKMLASFNDELKITKNIKIGVNFNYSRQNNPYGAAWALDAARKVMPQISAGTKTFKVRNPYGADSLSIPIYSGLNVALQNSGVVNPLLEIENTWDKTISIENRYVGSLFAEFTILKNLNFRSTWYGDVSNVDTRTYSPLYYAYNPMTNTPYLYNTKTSVSQNNIDYKKYQQDYILTYKNTFGNHSLTATGGFTTYYFGFFGRSATLSQGTGPLDLPIPNDKRFWYIGNNFFGVVNQGGASSSQGENTTVSGLFRVLYNFKNKYYFNASFRDDASSQIPEKNRHQQFWALGAAWEMTKEAFLSDVPWLNFFKLKASVGVLGNQSVYGLASQYPMYPGLRGGIFVPFGTNIVSGALASYQPNPDLRWETVNAAEGGFELNAFDNRLHFEYNYYDKVTKDMMTYADRGSLGLDPLLQNGGKVHNWGHEISATWTQKLNNDLTLDLGGNITFMKNKVLSVAPDLPGGLIINSYMNNGSAEARTKPGFPIAAFWGYVVDGIYQSKLDVLQSPPASSIGSYGPGDFKFKDMNGDGVIDANDRVMIGNPSPDFIYGGNINLKYKRFNVGIDIGGVYGNEIFRTWGSLESPFQRVNYAALKVNRWHGEGTSNWEPIISQGHRFNYNGSTYNIEDGSYFRIRNLQVGYDVPTSMMSRIGIKSLRVFANIQNLKTWKHNNGYAPEYGGSATGFGFDFGGGAIPRVTTFGLNVTF